MGADLDFVDAAFELGREAGRGEGAAEGAPAEEQTVRNTQAVRGEVRK